MAIVRQVSQSLAPSGPVPLGTFANGSNFGQNFNGSINSFEPTKFFSNYFERIHNRYEIVTTNIENLVNRFMEDNETTFRSLVRENTLLKDTFIHKWTGAKTSLGEVLKELESVQEFPGRKLLPKKIFNEAEKEAKELINKDVVLASEKKVSKQVLNEASSLKRQTSQVVKVGPEFQVNTYTTHDQWDSQVTRLSTGGFVVVWASDEYGSSYSGIYGQIFNPDGTKIGSEFPIKNFNVGGQLRPSSVTSLNNGNFVVAWNSGGMNGQIFNADGTKNGGEFQITANCDQGCLRSEIKGLSNGNFVVVWSKLTYCCPTPPTSVDIFGQIFDADGNKIGSEFSVNTYRTAEQDWQSISNLSNGKFVVTWNSMQYSPTPASIRGQIFNADGTKSGSEFKINTTPSSVGTFAGVTVASLRDDTFIVAWGNPYIYGNGPGIYGKIFGTQSGNEFTISTPDGGSWPSATSLNDNEFVVTWEANDDDKDGIFGQIINSNGTISGSKFPVNTYTTSGQRFPSVASLNNNQFVVTWTSDGQDGNMTGIYGQIFEIGNPDVSSAGRINSMLL